MRHGSGNRRNRNRSNNRKGGAQGGRSTVHDSNGPDVRIRGTAHQIVEKYAALAKDASSSGDLNLAENYLQHAEHYQRIINSWVSEQDDKKQALEEGKADSTEGEEQKAKVRKPRSARKPKEQDDLGLPTSILGEAPAAEAAKADEKASEKEVENA